MSKIFFNWWMVVLRGVVLILFGIYAVANPQFAIFTMVYSIGVFSLAYGLFILVSYIFKKKRKNWMLFLSIVDIIFGVIVVSYPISSTFATSTLFSVFLGFWAILGGVSLVGNAFIIKKRNGPRWGIILLGGILTLFVGLVIISDPIQEILAITIVIGVFAIIFGFTNIVWGLELKKVREHLNE